MQTIEPILKIAVNVFREINKRIQSLIVCSAHDFDILNFNFKDYHKKINTLSDLTNNLMKELFLLPEDKIEKCLEIVNNNHRLVQEMVSGSSQIHKSLTHIDKGIAYVSLYINNLKQNASTLRLLATNIQFDPRYRKLYDNLHSDIDNLSKCATILDQEFIHLSKRSNNCLVAIERSINYQIPAIIAAELKFKNELLKISDKKLKSSQYKISIEKLTTEKKEMSSEIITNLQFQDIIRQKIEHVQSAHEKLLENLEEIYTINIDEHVDTNSISVEVLSRIKDIGSLQAAQLIHANHEYQNAIENIIEKFRVLDNTLLETISLLQQLTEDENSHEEFTLRNSERIFSIFELETETLILDNKTLIYNYSDLLRKKEKLMESQGQLDCILSNIEEISKKIIPFTSPELTKNKFISPINQLLTGIDEFKKNALLINDILISEKLNLNSLNQESIDSYFKQFINLENNISNLNISAKDVIMGKNLSVPHFNLFWNEENRQESQFRIDQVEYYKVFDIEVEEIINQLNGLISQINFDNIRIESSTAELEKLKNMYTMDSERKVHDMFTGIQESSGSNNDDDVELF